MVKVVTISGTCSEVGKTGLVCDLKSSARKIFDRINALYVYGDPEPFPDLVSLVGDTVQRHTWALWSERDLDRIADRLRSSSVEHLQIAGRD